MDIQEAIEKLKDESIINNYIKFNLDGALDEAIKALKKQIPKRPTETQELMDIEWLCPVCGFQVSNSFGVDDYCGGCGQRIG